MHILDFSTSLRGVSVIIRVATSVLQAWRASPNKMNGRASFRERALDHARFHLRKAGAKAGETWMVTLDEQVTCRLLREVADAAS
jgi:hypothetical protein